MTTEIQSPISPQRSSEASPLWNILFNIVLPVTILNQLSRRLGDHGPQIALVCALLFPLAYGAREWWLKKKINPISLLGLVNVLITGSLAIAALHGRWFVLKEAALPTLLGLAIFISAFTKRPFIESIFLNPQILKLDLLNARLSETKNEARFHLSLKRATLLLSFSFLFSAIINFILASRIFTDLDETLPLLERTALLNQQIAHMTWLAAIIILVPSMAFTGGILWYLLHEIRTLTGLSAEEVLHN